MPDGSTPIAAPHVPDTFIYGVLAQWFPERIPPEIAAVASAYGGGTVAQIPQDMREMYLGHIAHVAGRKMPPLPQAAEVRQIDRAQLEPFLRRFTAAAGDTPGYFVACGYGEAPETYARLLPVIRPVPNDGNAVNALIGAFEEINRTPGLNGYLSIGLFKPPDQWKNPTGRGSEDDLIGTLAFVGDFDAARGHDPASCSDRLPVAPHVVVETSAGNFQPWAFLDKPYAVAEAKPIFEALTRALGSDSTFSCEHLFRPPGTVNWPTGKKVRDYGRSPEPQATRAVATDYARPAITLAELRESTLRKYPDAFKLAGPNPEFADGPAKHTGGANENSADFDWYRQDKERPLITLQDSTIMRYLSDTGDRSAAAFKFIAQCKRSGYTPEQVYELFISHQNLLVVTHYTEKGADFEKALRADIRRSFKKAADLEPMPRPAVFGTEGAYVHPPRREIRLAGDYLPHAVAEAESALLESGIALFQRGDRIVRPGDGSIRTARGGEAPAPRLFEVHCHELREHMTNCADFRKYRVASETWVPTNCPEEVARAYLERKGRHRLRPIAGIATAPVLRRDGSILDKPGWDAATALIYDPGDTVFPPAGTTRAEAESALADLKALIAGFPFVSDADRSVALSAILSAACRPAMDRAPLHLFSSSTPGTGKTMLANIASAIATGRAASAMTLGDTDRETETRIGAVLMAGDPVILLDNCSKPIGGDCLNSFLTADSMRIRILGKSEMPEVPNVYTLLATGLNLTVRTEITRRALRCTIEAGVERPELRPFDSDAEKDALRERPRYLAAALTIVRAFIVGGRPRQLDPIGSFGDWSRTVRDALLWLGEADPWLTVEGLREDDTATADLAALMDAWRGLWGEEAVSVADVVAAVQIGAGLPLPHGPGLTPEGTAKLTAFREAALAVAEDLRRSSGTISAVRLSKYLGRHVNRPVAGHRFERAGGDTHRNVTLWRLRPMPVAEMRGLAELGTAPAGSK